MATTALPRALAATSDTISRIKTSEKAKRPASARDFTYTAVIDCGDGNTTETVYVLRGDGGRYEEDFCGSAFQGSLVFVEALDVDIDGIVIPGWVYNGTDDTGVYGYHFGMNEVPEVGAFTVLIGAEHSPGGEFGLGGGMLATRTAP